jgi:Domain of unknown function (DUF4131)
VAAWIVFALSAAYLLRRRGRLAFIVGLGGLFFLGALMVQVRGQEGAGNPGWTRFADGAEVVVTAHVSKEGTLQEDSPGSVRQRIEVETEQIAKGEEIFDVKPEDVKFGLRLNIYQQQSKERSGSQRQHRARPLVSLRRAPAISRQDFSAA